MHKGQGRKPLLNEHDHPALRRYCLRTHHATMMDTAIWAREYFGKSLFLNTVTASKCINACRRGQEVQLFFRPNVRMWKKIARSDFDSGMIVVARQGALSISETVGSPGILKHTSL